MARFGYLYRRSSGIYVIRICVPLRLRAAMGRGEIHVSTNVRDIATAKVTAFQVLSHWQQRLLELDEMDILKIVEGSARLGGRGLIRLIDVATELGINPKSLLVEVINTRTVLLCIAKDWHGVVVADLNDVERDYDGTFILNSLPEVGEHQIISRPLILFNSRSAAQSLIEHDEYLGQVFFFDTKRHRAVFFDPGQTIKIHSLLILKAAAERIRISLSAGVTPAIFDAAQALRLPVLAVSPPYPSNSPAPAHANKYGEMLSSELMAKFLAGKKSDWKDDHQRKMAGMCGVFVELMNDPSLNEIDRPMIKEFLGQLQTLPDDLYQARRRYGVSSLAELIRATHLAGDPQMSASSANGYVRKLSEMLNWAVMEELIPRNPAGGVAGSGKRSRREQDERGVFDNAELASIFGVEWFQDGKGKLSKRGTFQTFQPHYYWLPLLGLYSGGRLNELAQLHLDDVKQDSVGIWYLDFNLDESDKLEIDLKNEPVIGNGEKSLKTVNSQRVVALHSRLLDLGLIRYVQALRNIGQHRLFPELRFDETKGYGKAAGSWFNERFLGDRLKIDRDGKKTFHSFRHMCISALYQAEVPPVTVAQIVGHERGETMSERRYRKDQDASKLKPYVERLTFNLPPIAEFDISAGLKAVADALDRKKRHHAAPLK